MIELSLNKIQKYYGANMILEDITFDVQSSEKVGIVGGNGCGKSSLLKIIMGIEEYEKGNLSIRKGASLAYLEQIPNYPENFKVLDVLNTAFEKLDKTYKELEILEKELSEVGEGDMDKLLDKYAKKQALYESLGGYEKEEKLNKVCTGLKINDNFKEKLFSQLSGGEKTTIILAKILLQNPDILLLDEPSNHLDIDSREELESFLKDFEGTLLFVSHDRYFINNLASRVVELDRGSLISYEGNYEYYKYKREELRKSSVINFSNNIESLKSKNKSKDIKKNKSNYEAKAVNKWKIAKLEDEIKKLEERVTSLEEEINKFSNNYEKLNELYNEKLNIENEIEKLMEEYFNLTS